MRTQITTDNSGRVTLSYDGEDGERITREFTCPTDGGWVREGSRQVCAGLATTGACLRAPSRAALVDVIRREFGRMRRAQRAA